MEIPKPLLEAIKELLRVVVLAVIPLALVQLEQGWVDYRALALVGAIAGLRFVDKLLYEEGKAKNKPRMKKGLVRF